LVLAECRSVILNRQSAIGNHQTAIDNTNRSPRGDRHMAIRPLDDRVLVEPLEAEEKTAGGILLPDTAKEKPQRGKVVAVGPGKLRDSCDRTALSVKVGDEVLFGRYAGSEVKEGGKEYKVMRESDILAKVGK
jgi:chaperonin GroES